MISKYFRPYITRLNDALTAFDWAPAEVLAEEMARVWKDQNQVFICGNGGSAGNAIHWANDFLYPVAKEATRGIHITAMPANAAVLTCLGNDLGYETVFAHQLNTQGKAGDILIVLSGSGNSANILRVLEMARSKGIKSFAILGFDGGKAKALADVPLHFAVQDMQVAEDLQMVICHMLTQALFPRGKEIV